MKKLLSILLAFILTFSAAIPALAANELPFELKAPANVALQYLDGNDSPTTHGFSYSIDNDMLKFFEAYEASSDREAFLKPYGLSDISVTLQIDWAIDDPDDPVSGWHYNKYWEYNEHYGSFGDDEEGYYRLGEWDDADVWTDFSSAVHVMWILRGVPNDDRLNGNPDTGRPGLKDQLRPEQYTYDYENEELFIDFAEHTVYARARFVMLGLSEDADGWRLLEVSPWSETAASGRYGEKYLPVTADDLPAPVISGLYMTDRQFNDNPIVAFTLTVPDNLAELSTKVTARGGVVWVLTEARVKGDEEWTDMDNSDTEIRTGELECALLHLVSDERPTVPKNAEIELRCRYACYQPGEDDVFSEYSEVITFETDDIHQGGSPAGEENHKPDGENSEPESDRCHICGFCPQPLGLCIFIWLAIFIFIIIVAVLVIVIVKKRKKQ
ncbi:MAG: hypothetical protein IJS72_01610 [Oscillospiraceae bacterium]|nr:hypothetical protein [Oscillospiraceae bacterium]